MATKRNEKTFEEVLETEGAVVTTLGEVLAAVDEADDEKTQFINENKDLIPNNRKNVFSTWPLQKQFDEINRWKKNQEWRKQWEENNKLENKVKDLFIRRKVTIDEVLTVIDFCKAWIKEEQDHEIARIDEEISRLELRKQMLEEAK